MTDLDPDSVRRAALWEQGNPCPWNGCPSVCIHLQGGTQLLCDACDTIWIPQAARDWLEANPEPQALLDWLVKALGYPFNGPISTDPVFPLEWRRRLAAAWLAYEPDPSLTVDDMLKTCAEEGGWDA